MSTAPAPVVAAAPVSATPVEPNGATGSEKPGPAPKPTGAQARANDGRYMPKVGEQAGAPAEKPEPPKEEELFELKVDDRVVKLTREQLLLRAQKADAADRRFMEASAKAKRAEELIAAFEADPEAALAKLGKDPAKILEGYLERKAREASLTPEQRELEATKRERDQLKKQMEAVETEKKAAAQQQLDERTAAQLTDTLLAKAKDYGLDQNPQTLDQLCDIALELIEYGIKPSADQLCQELIHRQREHITARDTKVLANIPDAKLAEYLGPAVIERIRKSSLAELPKPGVVAQAKPREPKEKPPAKGYLSETEFERSLGLRR